MSVQNFFTLVEARTKLASILPFGVGTLFALVYFHQFNGVNTALFFVAMLAFDMMTTALNNLMDYQKAKDEQYRRTVNIIGTAQLSVGLVRWVVIALLAVAAGLGLVLSARTDWLLLLVGAVCFAIGIFYTFGPLPLSRLPLGEVFSGLTMGLGIPFIATYINVDAQALLNLKLAWPTLSLTGNWLALLTLGLVCVTPMATIANVMLANNMSDLAEDERNHRITLPMYLGKKYAAWLYTFLALVGFAAVIVAVTLRLLPWPLLLALLPLPLAVCDARRFTAHPDKRTTFSLALRTLTLANLALMLGLVASLGVSR
ncbi:MULTISPECIES: 1,4-dihydroxy-2-naphthoate polyprenyltransferase [unclassified Lacticaseibacillus]|uniref:1,4-dihydroxy-2-naphthoate polyprenyltransferase n=1 Tax=unclassified Lacticaseibacillus TaxID=2759744 RepID=UPI001942814B|nr:MULTISPECIES: 1,4-dihydroxy-2-naphthoate polyprenyltransferase [unclassified Lacticaseibacillus]